MSPSPRTLRGARNPEDPPVVQDARKRLSEAPGAVSVISDIRNLADKDDISNVQAQIAATPASAAYWPGDGRAVFGGLAWSF